MGIVIGNCLWVDGEMINWLETDTWKLFGATETHFVWYVHMCVLVQFSSVAQSCLTLCNPMDCSTPGFPVHHQHLDLAQTHVYQAGDAIQPSHPLSSPSPPTEGGIRLYPESRTPSWAKLWAICLVSMETTYQLENQAPGRNTPRALHYLKEYPNYLCNRI